MTLSIEGAGLIAQVYPVGLLVVALEGRGILARTLKDVPPRKNPKRSLLTWREAATARNTYETVWTISLIWALLAEGLCIWSVCNNQTLAPGWAWMVIVAGAFLGLGVLMTLGRAIRPEDGESKASAQ